VLGIIMVCECLQLLAVACNCQMKRWRDEEHDDHAGGAFPLPFATGNAIPHPLTLTLPSIHPTICKPGQVSQPHVVCNEFVLPAANMQGQLQRNARQKGYANRFVSVLKEQKSPAVKISAQTGLQTVLARQASLELVKTIVHSSVSRDCPLSHALTMIDCITGIASVRAEAGQHES
jgi:hypothetical protein